MMRNIGSIEIPRWGRVVRVHERVGWLVLDPDGVAVEPIRRFLLDFLARDNRTGSVRSYAFVLLRWWRWLRAVGVEWDKATPSEARDLGVVAASGHQAAELAACRVRGDGRHDQPGDPQAAPRRRLRAQDDPPQQRPWCAASTSSGSSAARAR